MSVTEQFDYIHYLMQRYKFDKSALEENSIHNMSKNIDAFDFEYILFWTAGSDPKKKLRPSMEDAVTYKDKRHTVGKPGLIGRLATEFENNNIKIPYKTEADKIIAHDILTECVSYARDKGRIIEAGVHPDIPIALAYALEVATMGGGAIIDF